jgi:hypothetical protein
MGTQGDPEPAGEPDVPPGLTTKADQYLFRRIEEVSSGMNEIVKAVDAFPARVDAKIEPLNNRLATIVQAIESLPMLSKNVEKISEEFAGFRNFRDRIEGREKLIEDSIKKSAAWVVRGVVGAALATASVIVTVAGTGYYIGSTLTGIKADVANMTKSSGEMKSSVDALQKTAFDLNGSASRQDQSLKDQGARLENIDRDLRAMQLSVRESSAKTAAESSDSTVERIGGLLKSQEKRAGTRAEDLTKRVGAIERKLEEVTDVWVLSLTLAPSSRPEIKSDTQLVFEVEIPQQQRRPVSERTYLAGAVRFVDPDVRSHLKGFVMGTAFPIGQDKARVTLFFDSKSALSAFVLELAERRSIRVRAAVVPE